MLASLLRFELRYHFSQLTFKIAAFLFFGLGMAAVQGNFGSVYVHKNSPYVFTMLISLLSMASIFASTLFCANVVLRDTAYQMETLIFTTRIKRFSYFFVRFAGLMITVSIVLLLAALGMFLGTLLIDPDRLGVFKISYLVQPFLIFGIPNVLFSASLIFCTAAITRNTRAVYAAGVLIYILYWTGSILGNSPLIATSALQVNKPGLLPLLSDPFGLAAFFAQTRSWADTQLNTQLFELKDEFLLNRLLWLAFTLLIVVVTFRYFRFATRQQQQNLPKQIKAQPDGLIAVPFKPVLVHPQGYYYHLAAFFSQLKLEVVSLFKHIPFMVMMLLWVFLFTMELNDSLYSGPYGISSYPVTGIFIEKLQAVKLGLILIIFYSAELLWRERSANVQGLIYSTPIPGSILWAAKSAALAILVIILISCNIVIGVSLQLSKGYDKLEILNYLGLYYYSGLPLFLFALLVIFVQNLTTNKYLGMLLSMAVIFSIVFSSRLGIEHYLLRYATVPEMNYSYMNGFGHYGSSFSWYILYWGSIAGLLSVLTIGMWQNAGQSGFWQRWKATWKVLKEWKFVCSFLILSGLSNGAYIYYQTNVTGNYLTREEKLSWQIQYEQRYKPFERLPQPVITKVKTEVDLYPEKGKYLVKGSYILRNETLKSISRLWIGLDPEVSSFNIAITGTKHIKTDAKFNQQWIDLKVPLVPGGTMAMKFSMVVYRSGFMQFNSENSLVKNGTYIELEKYVPQFGYNSSLETDDRTARKNAGLPEVPEVSCSDTRYHLIDFETTVSTAADQYVITVGELNKTWTHQHRSYFNYKTSVPVNFMFALSAAVYQFKEETYKGIKLKLCYQQGQEYNTGTMMQALKDALDYCQLNFGAYHLKHFTLAEIPQYRGAATAYPGLMFSAERINFLSDFSDTSRANYEYPIVAHELAHQWWGNQLTPASGPGSALLTESLAKYTENMVVEKNMGKMYLREFLRADNGLYFALRNGNGKELPLTSTIDQSFVYYQKGGLAMYAIKEALGEKPLSLALSYLIKHHESPLRRAKPDDLLQELYNQASPSQIRVIDANLNQVLINRLSVKVLSCRFEAAGQYKLTLQVSVAGDRSLKVSDDEFDIAIFDQPVDKWNLRLKPVYIKKYRFKPGNFVITLLLPQKPGAVAIDPYGYVLDENLADNVQNVAK